MNFAPVTLAAPDGRRRPQGRPVRRAAGAGLRRASSDGARRDARRGAGMSLLAVGISHQTAPVALLEQFAMAADDRVKALHELVDERPRQRGPGAGDLQPDRGLRRGRDASTAASPTSAGSWPARPARRSRSSPRTSPSTTRTRPSRTCSPSPPGLDSMVVGETQVLGQLRAAYALAREEGTVGRALHPVAQRALRVGKRVHTETGIDRAGASLVSVALDRAEERIGEPGRPPRARRRRRLDGRARRDHAGPPRRRPSSSAAAPRPRRPAGRRRRRPGRRRSPTCPPSWPPPTCWSPAPAPPASSSAPTSSPPRMAGRGGRPLVVVDLALPRDVDPGVAALPGVHVVDLALLQGERAATPGRPTAGPVAADDITAAHALVEAETALLRAERQAAEVAPDRLRAAQPGRRGRRRRAAAAVHPAARPRRPRPRRDRPHRAPRRRQAAARADRPGEGAGRGARRHRLRRRAARAVRPRASTPRSSELAEAVTVDPALTPGEAS